MADGISIPGVTDKYKTNDLVDSLMEVERIPLKREQKQLEAYKSQQDVWRGVNTRMTSLRESVKSLYSFENPFNNKLASSSDENAVTVSADRDAEYGQFQLDVLNPAEADRFISGKLDKDFRVEEGKYVFEVGGKSLEFNWKGGKLADFVSALNKRGNGLVKATIIGITKNEKALVLESLKTGEVNRLILKDKALDFATSIGMVSPVKAETTPLASSIDSFSAPSDIVNEQLPVQEGLPEISKDNVTYKDSKITIPARSGVEIPLNESLKSGEDTRIEFSFNTKETSDITVALNNARLSPQLPDPGFITFKGITVQNEQSDTTLSVAAGSLTEPLTPVDIDSYVFIKNADGSETELPESAFTRDENTGETKVSFSLNDYPGAQGIILRNSNTGKEISVSMPQTYDAAKNIGFTPNNPIATAKDAKVKYEGITITRPSNDIDDLVPSVTLHLHAKTNKTATVKVLPDTQSAKDALITFIGKYNQLVAEINILSSNKPEVVTELDYLTKEEQDAEMEKLGMFQSDFSLTNSKSTMQRIISASYKYTDDENTEDLITMLNQIGISTNASGGASGYNPSRMRGYLEADEKKLDEQLETNLEQIKNLFGYDTDGDLIIDNGIGYLLDKHLTSWVQVGGIIATKTSALDTKIQSSNTKISNLERKLDDKEAELKNKYSTMEGTLNSLESQQTTITNFTNANSNKK